MKNRDSQIQHLTLHAIDKIRRSVKLGGEPSEVMFRDIPELTTLAEIFNIKGAGGRLGYQLFMQLYGSKDYTGADWELERTKIASKYCRFPLRARLSIEFIDTNFRPFCANSADPVFIKNGAVSIRGNQMYLEQVFSDPCIVNDESGQAIYERALLFVTALKFNGLLFSVPKSEMEASDLLLEELSPCYDPYIAIYHTPKEYLDVIRKNRILSDRYNLVRVLNMPVLGSDDPGMKQIMAACGWLWQSHCSPNNDRKLVYLIIGIEALLYMSAEDAEITSGASEDRGAITKSLCLMCAYSLSDIPQEQARIYKEMRIAYKNRSIVVHGKSIPRTVDKVSMIHSVSGILESLIKKRLLAINELMISQRRT